MRRSIPCRVDRPAWTVQRRTRPARDAGILSAGQQTLHLTRKQAISPEVLPIECFALFSPYLVSVLLCVCFSLSRSFISSKSSRPQRRRAPEACATVPLNLHLRLHLEEVARSPPTSPPESSPKSSPASSPIYLVLHLTSLKISPKASLKSSPTSPKSLNYLLIS